MATEISHRHTATGDTIYFTVRSLARTYWNGSILETLTVGNWGNYDIATEETPASSYFYVGDWPAALSTVGWYWVDLFKRIGGSPAISDTLVASYFGYWNGTTFQWWDTNLRDVKGTTLPAEVESGCMAAGLGKFLNVAAASQKLTVASEVQTADVGAGVSLRTITTLSVSGTLSPSVTGSYASTSYVRNNALKWFSGSTYYWISFNGLYWVLTADQDGSETGAWWTSDALISANWQPHGTATGVATTAATVVLNPAAGPLEQASPSTSLVAAFQDGLPSDTAAATKTALETSESADGLPAIRNNTTIALSPPIVVSGDTAADGYFTPQGSYNGAIYYLSLQSYYIWKSSNTPTKYRISESIGEATDYWEKTGGPTGTYNPRGSVAGNPVAARYDPTTIPAESAVAVAASTPAAGFFTNSLAGIGLTEEQAEQLSLLAATLCGTAGKVVLDLSAKTFTVYDADNAQILYRQSFETTSTTQTFLAQT